MVKTGVKKKKTVNVVLNIKKGSDGLKNYEKGKTMEASITFLYKITIIVLFEYWCQILF